MGELFYCAACIILTLGLPLLARLLPGAAAPGGRLRWRVDLPLGLALGLGVALIAYGHSSRLHLAGEVLAFDFEDYCRATGALRDGLSGLPSWSVSRQPFPALLSAALARQVGVIQGLAWSSFIALGLLALQLYLWGTLLRGRTAGVAAAVLLCGVGPLALLSRNLTFYPEMAALLACGGLLGTLALLRRTPAAMAAGSAGLGLALLADQLALFWVLPLLLALVVVAARSPRRWRRLAALVPPLLASWLVAHALPTPTMELPSDGLKEVPQTLELRLQEHLVAHLTGAGESPLSKVTQDGGAIRPAAQLTDEQLDRQFLWGRSNPLYLPLTLLETARLVWGSVGRFPELVRVSEAAEDRASAQVIFWMVIYLVGLVLASLSLARAPGRLACLWLSVLPFFLFFLATYPMAVRFPHMQLHSTGAMVNGESYLVLPPRHLALGLVPVPLLLGLAWAALAGRFFPRSSAASAPRRPWPWGVARSALALGCALLLVLGWLPSVFSPDTPWKRRIAQESYTIKELVRLSWDDPPGSAENHPDIIMQRCLDELMEDKRADRVLDPGLYRRELK